MRNTRLSLKLQLFKGRLFDVFKKEKAEQKAKSEDDSDLLNLCKQSTTITILQL